MCGRFSQYSDTRLFAGLMGLEPPVAEHAAGGRPRYNVAPQTPVWTFHRLGQERSASADLVRWGYKPAWAHDRPDLPMVINARMEDIATKPYYRELWREGRRVIVPADGWFEWPVLGGNKVPHFITRRDGPCFFAGLSSWWPGDAPLPFGHGVVIITAKADGELTTVHDRRPLVLSAEDALTWLDPLSSPEQAGVLMEERLVPASAFVWWPVSPAVGNPRNDGVSLIRNHMK